MIQLTLVFSGVYFVYFTLLHVVQLDSSGLQVVSDNYMESIWSPHEPYLNLHICSKYTWSPGELNLNSRWSPPELHMNFT